MRRLRTREPENRLEQAPGPGSGLGPAELLEPEARLKGLQPPPLGGTGGGTRSRAREIGV